MGFPVLLAAELNPYLSVLLENLLEIVGSLILIAAVPLVRYLVKLLEQKIGVDISAEKEAQLEAALIDSIAHAEEWARGKVALKEDAPAGAQKMSKAIDFVQDEMKRKGLDQMSKEKLQDLLNAKLGLSR